MSCLSRSRQTRRVLFALVAFSGAVVPAHSSPPRGILVSYPEDCKTPPLRMAEVIAALKVEFRAQGLELERGGANAVQVRFLFEECSSEADAVRVSIAFPSEVRGGLRLETDISLRDVPGESRARTVAVAVSELYRVADGGESGASPANELKAEPAPPPSSDAPLKQPDPAPPPVTEARSRPSSLGAAPRPEDGESPQGPMIYEAHASVQGLAMETPAFLGGGLGFRYQLAPRVWARAALDAHSSSTRTALGRVSLSSVSGSMGLDYVLDDQPRLCFGPSIQPLWVLARATSDATGLSENHSDSTLSMGARFGIEGRLAEGVHLSFSIELGAFVKEAVFRAAGRDAITFSGFTGGGLVGFAFQP